MPIYNRRGLRQRLGQDYIRDTVVGDTSGSWGTQAGSFNILDSAQADPTASGEQLFQRAYLRLLGTALFIQDVRVASFNTGSGAYVGAQTLATTVFSGMPYEVHKVLSPVDKERALDIVIQDLRFNQEVPISSIENGHIYSLGTDIIDILDVRYLSDPSDSLNIGEHTLQWWKYEKTGSGQSLRIDPSLPASYQLILDAVVDASLGSGELATIYLPSDSWVLWGAAARCYWMIEQESPSQETKLYQERRRECAAKFTRLSRKFQPVIKRRIMLEERW